MTRKNARCRCFAIAASLSGALACVGAAAAPGGLQMAAAPAAGAGVPDTAGPGAGAHELYLEVTLNQAPTGRLARFFELHGALWTDAQTLRELGLQWPGSAQAQGLLPLAALPGLSATYDAARQRVALVVPVPMLARPVARLQATEADRPRVDPAARLAGVVLNYDIYGQHSKSLTSSSSLSAWSELRLFGAGPGVWSNTMVNRVDSGHGAGTRSGTVRLDTSWQRDFPDSMVSLTVGDTVTGALSWTRSTRIGGIRLSRNFSLQPYLVTAPLAMVQGEAALPSTVDLYIDGMRQSSQQVQPGQFELGGLPSLNGLGQAQMVITDINGQRRTVNFSLYGAPQLLQAGMLDGSVEFGMVRRDYGIRSFSYDRRPMASASARYGWSDRTTLEAHAEASADVRVFGAGGVWRVGERAGVFNAAAALSQHAGRLGRQSSAGYQWNSSRFNVAASSLRRDRDFRDVASLHGSALARASDQIYLGTSTGWGAFGLGLVRQQYTEMAPMRFVNLSWTRQLPHNASLNVSAVRNLGDRRGASLYVSLSVPLERYLSASASVRHSRHETSATVGAIRSAPSDEGGWGWRAEAGVGDSRIAQAQVNRIGPHGQWTAGVSYLPGTGGAPSSTTTYAGISGGLLWAGGQGFAMRQVDDAFALVSTSGVPEVPVKLENRLIGTTDAKGLLLVNRLNAYQRNQLSIDPMQLPADMRVDRVDLDAVPESRTGVLARFGMRRVLALQASLHDPQGQPLAAGSRVWLDAPEAEPRPLVVGYDGLVYVEDPPQGAALRAETAGGVCRAPLPDGLNATGVAEVGVLVCR